MAKSPFSGRLGLSDHHCSFRAPVRKLFRDFVRGVDLSKEMDDLPYWTTSNNRRILFLSFCPSTLPEPVFVEVGMADT